MTSQIDKDGLVLPGSVALLNGTGSINVHQRNLFPVYIPLEFIQTTKFDSPEEIKKDLEQSIDQKIDTEVKNKQELKNLITVSALDDGSEEKQTQKKEL